LDTGVIVFGRVALGLCVLERRISYFDDVLNFDTTIWIFINTNELLVSSSLKREKLK